MPLLKRIVRSETLVPQTTNGRTNVGRSAKPPAVAPDSNVTPIRPAIWGTSHDGKRQQRALLASATNISNGTSTNRVEAQRLPKLKQAWQEDAWAYRDSIGELRYATTYLGNAARKIKLFPAAYVEGELDPLPLTAIDDCPPEVIAAANDALNRIAATPLAMAGILRDVAENFEVAGECFLVGWPPGTYNDNTEEIWEIRSTSEMTADNEGNLVLKEAGQTSGSEPIADSVFASRLWYPHPKRKMLADSPFAAILDICEELLILSRDIRASGRSRLANNGLLLLPDTLTVVKANVADDANDDEQDPFMQELIAAAMTAIQDEGSASAIVPIIVRGPKDDLAAARQLTISRPDSANAQKRTELIGRMATALDLPAEVLTGKADLNHWTAWSVSDDTFSDHIEPLVMVIDDAITAGYLKFALKAANVDPVWVNRIIIWHDATRLVRHPDRSQDAISAYDRFAVSQKALRGTMGFSDADAPSEVEVLERLVAKQARLDPTIVAQIIKRMDNSLDVSATLNPGGGTAIPPPAQGEPPGAGSAVPPNATPGGPPQNGQPQQESPEDQTTPSPASSITRNAVGSKTFQGRSPKALVAASTPAHITNGSKRLSKIDADLANKLLVATNAAMARALERAGARIRTQVGRTASGRAWCATHKNIELPFLISGSMIAAAGLDEAEIFNNAWQTLSKEWETYLESSDMDALQTVAKMLKVDPDELGDLADSLGEYADNSWGWLEGKLSQVAKGYLHNAANVVEDEHDITTTELVPYDIVRESVARAGGEPSSTSAGVRIGEDPTTAPTPLGGIGTGPAVSDRLKSGGLEIAGYTWIHGSTGAPFPPHEDLDGVEFQNWTDEILANSGDFPDGDYYAPGDHDGCTCDFDISWRESGSGESDGPDEGSDDNGDLAASAHFGGPGSGPQGGRHEKESTGHEKAGPTEGMSRTDACQYAKDNAGMAKGTAGKLYDQGRLDQSIALANTQQPDEVVSKAQDLAKEKNDAYAATITPEDKAAAEERHANSSRQGGDDRPGYPTRVKMTEKLTAEFGDGKTCPCVYCARSLEPGTVSLDRLVPGSEGGKYVMANLAPTCYDCNNWRGNAPFDDAMRNAKDYMDSLAAAGDDPTKPIIPLGTMVTARTVGYSHDPENSDPDMPADIPLAVVSGKLDGFYVGAFGYFKYIVAGYDVDQDTIVAMSDAEIAADEEAHNEPT